MVLRGINRTVWGTRLLLTSVLTSFVDCISLCHKLKAQHCSLSLSGLLCGLYQFVPQTEGTALLSESEWLL